MKLRDILNTHETFEDRYNFDVSSMVESKNGLSYISWANAQKLARMTDEKFSWVPLPNESGDLNHNGMVLIKMTYRGETQTHYFPILDYRNKPIQSPTAFNINTSQMRGMTKLFSMISGYGLKLYTGEDLKMMDIDEQQQKNQKDNSTLLTPAQKEAINKGVELNLVDLPKAISYYNTQGYNFKSLNDMPFEVATKLIKAKNL